ncbi:MAG TPA: hypothetical protein VF993_14865 [Myxococcales bacterium]
MKHLPKAMALLLAVSLAAPRAAQAHGGDTGLIIFDIFLNVLALGVEAAALEEHAAAAPRESWQQRADDDWPPPRWAPPRIVHPRHDARQGLLLSFGLGGGSLFISQPDAGRTGAFDLNFRLGYGFSDRFQLFGDATFDGATYPNGQDIASWTMTMRGQTVLIGDRAGNGLNLNAGVGLGGVTRSYGNSYNSVSSPTGLALVGGISYDARLSHFFSLSPEFYVTWHAIPNRAGLAQDVATSYGLRLNFLWYIF